MSCSLKRQVPALHREPLIANSTLSIGGIQCLILERSLEISYFFECVFSSLNSQMELEIQIM